MKSLVAYFSRADENYFGGALKYVEIGNTEVVAKKIAEKTNSDLFKIEMEKPFAPEYYTCTTLAKKQKQNKDRPELAHYIDSIEQYDTIYLGYPNYWGTMPMVMFTFIEKYDFSGKTIKPFCTHEGGGLGKSIEALQKKCPNSKIEEGLAIVGSKVNDADDLINKWI